jgi:hypothetical protein
MRLSAPTLLVALLAARSLAQAPLPEIQGDDPPGFYRSASYPPADWSSQEVNASLQAYPFVRYDGDIRVAFARSLLRELVDPRYQETNVAPGARLDSFPMPGVDIVLRVRFQEPAYGQPHERMRMALIVGGGVAIIDAQAVSMQSWQHVLPQLNAFSASLRVVSGTPAPTYAAPAGPTASGLAGLYMGFLYKYDAIRGQSIYAAYYYLFSADGRVYRHYDELTVPGNDPARFDFNGAQRADPENSGQYTISGDQVFVRIGPPQNQKTFTTHLPKKNIMMIQGVEYERQ